MARLTDVRTAIIQIEPEASTLVEPVTEDVTDSELGEWTFDDDDFWEALDMMETSHKMIKSLLTICQKSLPMVRWREIENHCDDLKQFTGEFVVDASKIGDGL